jgi:hypothetical protein
LSAFFVSENAGPKRPFYPCQICGHQRPFVQHLNVSPRSPLYRLFACLLPHAVHFPNAVPP